jgi:signal peptidase I
MEPTLQVGDYILVSKYPYGWSRHSIPLSPPLPEGRLLGQAPARGDIVVFKKPNDGRTDIIKRLIGLPGDKVQVVEGVLRINDRPVRRQWLSTAVEAPFGEAIPVGRFKETLPGGRTYETHGWGSGTPGANTGVYTVPQGCFFVMGDNRDNSLDSRFDAGPIPGASRPAPGTARWTPICRRNWAWAMCPPTTWWAAPSWWWLDEPRGQRAQALDPGQPHALGAHVQAAGGQRELNLGCHPAWRSEDPGPPQAPRSRVGPGSARCALVRDDNGGGGEGRPAYPTNARSITKSPGSALEPSVRPWASSRAAVSLIMAIEPQSMARSCSGSNFTCSRPRSANSWPA